MAFNKERLIQLREQKGMCRKQLSEASGVNMTTISRIERGKTKNPYYDTMIAIAKCLKVNVETFRTGKKLVT